MRGRNRPFRQANWRAVIGHCLVVCFFLRALIPVGYMPDVEAARSGIFKFVDCRDHGRKAGHADPAGHHHGHAHTHAAGVDEPGFESGHGEGDESSHPHDRGDGGSADEHCAFAAAASATLLPVALALAIDPPSSRPAALAGPASFDLPPLRVGPHLGARAPPSPRQMTI
jgi:hypothetical protein